MGDDSISSDEEDEIDYQISELEEETDSDQDLPLDEVDLALEKDQYESWWSKTGSVLNESWSRGKKIYRWEKYGFQEVILSEPTARGIKWFLLLIIMIFDPFV